MNRSHFFHGDFGPLSAALLFFGFLLIGGSIWAACASLGRAARCRGSWLRADGRIQAFGVTYGVAEIEYEYTVDGAVLSGKSFFPGTLAKHSAAQTIGKRAYLNADGSLKFPPGAKVIVFYDPANPSDATLATGVAPGFWKTTVALFLLGAFFLAVPIRMGWLSDHKELSFGALFAVGGAPAFYFGIKCVRRCARARYFPSTTGRLLNAGVAYSSDGGEGAGGYAPAVQFEYEVNGAHYRSRQVTSINVTMQKSRARDVQPMIDKWRAQPELIVYYDPRAPWDGFLQQSSYGAAMLPLLMGVVSGAVGVAFMLYLPRR